MCIRDRRYPANRPSPRRCFETRGYLGQNAHGSAPVSYTHLSFAVPEDGELVLPEHLSAHGEEQYAAWYQSALERYDV